MTTRMFGERVERREDERLLTGRGRFTDDFEHDALEAAFVRSDHGHARITGIDVSEVVDLDGVFGVYTHEDLEGEVAERLPLLMPHDAIVRPRTQYALAKEEVCYVGEPVCMVVAVNRYVAEDAASRIRVDYEPLPAVTDLVEAASEDAPTVHAGAPSNLAAELTEETGDVDAAMAEATHVFAWRFDISRSASMPMEGRAVVARYDAKEDALFVYDTTQAPTSIRSGLALLFGMHVDHVQVVAPDVGGGFGVKVMQFYSEEVLVPWAARHLQRTVKWTEDRREHFVASNHERRQVHDVRVGVDDDGRILALETTFLHDTGAYVPYGITIPIITAAQLPGPYRLTNYRYAFQVIYTSAVPTSPYRGAGRPHGVFVMERVIQRVARELGLDDLDVRRRNFVQPDEFPYHVGVTFQDGGPTVYDSGDYPKGLDALLDALDLDAVRKERAAAQAEGRRVGIGFGCYVEGTGIGPYEGGAVQILPDGTVTVATGLATQGQGHETILAQLCAEELGVPIDRIHVTTGDTRRIGYGVGTFASRSAVMAGNAVAKAAKAVRARVAELAARTLEASVDDLEFDDGMVRVVGSPETAVPLSQLALVANPLRYAYGRQAEAAARLSQSAYAHSELPLPDGATPSLQALEYYSPPSGVYGFGAHAVVVEIDPDTCDLKILRYVAMHDSGRIINPMIVDGQVLGGVAQGVGGAFYERMAYDDDGQLINASFMDFLIPYATEVPDVELVHTETPSPTNVLGVKGVGEAGVIPVAVAIANAVEDALDTPVDRVPLSPLGMFELVSTSAPGGAAA